MVDLDATDWRVARFLHAILDRGNFPNWSRLTMGGHDAGLGGRHIMTEEAGDRTEALRRRRVPCMIAFLHPFRLVDVDGVAAWNAPIEQINGGWDYVALHRLVGGDVGLEPPYPLVVGRDGALALPPLADLRSLQLLVEAPYFQGEAIARRSTRMASASDRSSTGPTSAHQFASAELNRFHEDVRQLQVSPMEAIAPVQPRQVRLTELQTAMPTGLRMLDAVPAVRGMYPLKGTTGLLGSALANLWILLEQLMAEVRGHKVVAPPLETGLGKGLPAPIEPSARPD